MELATVVTPDRLDADADPPWARRAIAAPLTIVVMAALVASTAFLDTHPADVAPISDWASTNIGNLGSHPVAALLASAFVAPGFPWRELLLVAIGCAVVERALGVRRAVLIGLGGHVLATLITEYGAAIASNLHLIVPSAPDRSDVGVSYVMYTLLGAAAVVLPTRWRVAALGCLGLMVGLPVLADPGMTTAGHVLSVTCGIAGAAIMIRSRARAERPSPAITATGGYTVTRSFGGFTATRGISAFGGVGCFGRLAAHALRSTARVERSG